MGTRISDLWTPDVWLQEMNEKMATMPSMINSPLVVRTSEFDGFATGPGITVNLPYFRDITGQSDAPQVEATQPTRQSIGSGRQIAPVLNRETANDASALARAVSGADPVGAITTQIVTRRQKQRQTTMLAICRGIFGFSNGPGGAGALQACRNDIFSETGANPSANNIISTFSVIDAIALLGELADTTLGGGIAMHPLIRGALLKQDQISFQHYSLQNGTVLAGPAPATGQGYVETYKGYRVFISNQLVRAGTVSGFVFDTYIFAPGVFAWGEKAQVAGPVNQPEIDVAELALWSTSQTNLAEIYDRTRFLLHPNGLKWGGTPGGQSATNAELATQGNWTLDYSTADRVGIACIRSNG